MTRVCRVPRRGPPVRAVGQGELDGRCCTQECRPCSLSRGLLCLAMSDSMTVFLVTRLRRQAQRCVGVGDGDDVDDGVGIGVGVSISISVGVDVISVIVCVGDGLCQLPRLHEQNRTRAG